jgi:hypothetical protein
MTMRQNVASTPPTKHLRQIIRIDEAEVRRHLGDLVRMPSNP